MYHNLINFYFILIYQIIHLNLHSLFKCLCYINLKIILYIFDPITYIMLKYIKIEFKLIYFKSLYKQLKMEGVINH